MIGLKASLLSHLILQEYPWNLNSGLRDKAIRWIQGGYFDLAETCADNPDRYT